MRKLFKKMFLASVLTLSPTFILSSCDSEEPVNPNEETFTIKTSFNSEQGTVTLDKSSGTVGERVKATITPNEGFKISGIKFNEETRQAATSLDLTPVKGENLLSVTFESSTNVEKSLVLSGNYKTQYKIGETLTFEELEVKLVTTTNGVSDGGVTYTDYKTSVAEGYKFEESDLTIEGETFDISIYSEDETITSAILEVTVSEAEVEAVDITPAQFLRKMKETERYTVSNDEMDGVYIPNANFWTAKEASYTTCGFAQDGSRIIVYGIIEDRYYEMSSYDQTNKEVGYDGMYDPAFDQYLIDIEDIYHNRGIGFISDEEIANYEKTLKATPTNPNVYNVNIPDDPSSVYARDLVQLTYSGTLALNDFGLKATMGYGAIIKLTMLSETSMKIDIVNSTSVRYWPISTVITLDETADIPQIKPFLDGEELVDPELEKSKKAFELIRKGNFTTSLEDTYTADYTYRKETNSAEFSKETDFKYGTNSYTAGNYRVLFNKDNSVKSLSAIEIGGFSNIGNNGMLNKDELYLTYWDEETNNLTLTIYANYDTQDYLTSIPNLYCNLFNLDINTTDEEYYFENLEFKVHFTDKECTIIDCINVKFGRQYDSKTIDLKNFGTSKVDHVDTFINSLK